MVRVAVLDEDRCRPKRCDRACYRFCPKVRSNVEAIRFEDDRPLVVEALCVGCGICVKKCPFNALSIVNLPDELEEECSHRFGPNTFKLFRLPIPSSGVVLGLLGQNGIGKTTALNILSGETQLNLGNYEEPPDWPQIIEHFRGSILQEYLQKLSDNELRVVYKPQYVDKIPRAVSGKVGELLENVNERGKLDPLAEQLQLRTVWDRTLNVLSGGELQRVSIAATICREADVYLFDEPSSYLDVKQRLQAARAIRSLKKDEKTVIVAEHDLAILDYLSDRICVFYGSPRVYGASHEAGETLLRWDGMKKSFEGFELSVVPGDARQSEVIGILGPNGIGKTTFVRLLAGIEKPDRMKAAQSELAVSYKPQYISAEYEGTVGDLLKNVAKEDFTSSWYRSEILQPLNVHLTLDRNVAELSGGELQKVAIAACLSRKAQLYLLDEPSAYLDDGQAGC